LTAIVAKEDETYVLRLGPIPLAKNALCGINEFGRTDYEDQAHFLDVMEEGEFTINKHGINARIRATTTIIASANPINNSTWQDSEIININEIPALRPIIDRFDLIFVFRPRRNEDEIRDYAYRKSGFESNKIPDYSNYVIKHLEYAKRFNPVISDEAQQMLNEFFIKIMLEDNFGSNRILDSLFRISKAFARLKLKKVVDGDDANETIEFYNVVLQQYQRVVNVPSNPRDVTFNECLKILRETQVAITLEELLKQACHNNHYIERYICFGNKPLRLRDNIKVRRVYDMLLNHTDVRRVQEKPVILQWLCDECDPCDTEKNTSGEDIKEKSSPQVAKISNAPNSNLRDSSIENAVSHTSHGSHRNKIDPNVDYPPDCYYCNEIFDGIGKQGYEKHVIQKHANKPCYPGKADMELYSLTPKGMSWEV
jgi:replicative DNA helicase Mcm